MGIPITWFVAVGPEGAFPVMLPFRYQALALSAALFREWFIARGDASDDEQEAAWFPPAPDEASEWGVLPCLNPHDGQAAFLVTAPKGCLAHRFTGKAEAESALATLQVAQKMHSSGS
jgi:hypothetical protein